MYLQPSMKVLTVGDGDLTFSRSLRCFHSISDLTASVLDSESDLRRKYADNAVDDLNDSGVSIQFNADITAPETFPSHFHGSFDLVIFQFPLIPSFASFANYQRTKQWGNNGLNRLLLYKYLHNCFSTLLSPTGARMVYVTSKDVKPYCDWNIENLHRSITDVKFLGWQPFILDNFPGYVLRNVDRDKSIKSTSAKTYVWSDKQNTEDSLTLNGSNKFEPNYCSLCDKGPFKNTGQRQLHNQSKRHKKLQGYEDVWQSILLQQS